MKPARQESECSARTSELRHTRKATWPSPGSVVMPGIATGAVSGVMPPARTQTASSRPTAIAALPTSQARSTGHGAVFQRRSVSRVAVLPCTSARSPSRILRGDRPPRPPGTPTSAHIGQRAHVRAQRPPPPAPAQPGDECDGLERDPPRHLRPALRAVAEGDRDLAHAEAGLHGAVGQLDLEDVAVRAGLGEVDRLQHLAPEALEAAG